MQHTAEPDQKCWRWAQVQQVVFLGIDLVKQHTAVPNMNPNCCKQEQGEAQWWGAQRQEEVWELWKHVIKPSEHGVESYDNLGFPKLSGHVQFVVPHFEHVLELLEEFDPYNPKLN